MQAQLANDGVNVSSGNVALAVYQAYQCTYSYKYF